ncbi:MAG: integration host factor subunit alpha [Holosporaceae bacterium]|jgi:integration host factor subunit alpha|nr:integration host factor subunit alpha [Holosporaceae bacterium]
MKNKKLGTLTRSDVANAITEEFGVTKFLASEMLEEILNEIAAALVNGEIVKIAGFGTFSIRQKKERIGRNPKTLEKAVISSRKSLTFKASPILKKIVNNESDD